MMGMMIGKLSPPVKRGLSMSENNLNIRANIPKIARFNRKNLMFIIAFLALLFLLVTLWGTRVSKDKLDGYENVAGSRPLNNVIKGNLSYLDTLKEPTPIQLPAKENNTEYDKLLAKIAALEAAMKEKKKQPLTKRAEKRFKSKALPPKEQKQLPPKPVEDPNLGAHESAIFFSNDQPASKTNEVPEEKSGLDPSRVPPPRGGSMTEFDMKGISDMMGGIMGGDSEEMLAQNNQKEKREFVQKSQSLDKVYLDDTLHSPVSPYEVKEGTIIPCTLITGLNSDLPGQILAQIRENVYDSVTGNHLLLAQGSRLVGQYDSVISYGQKRILVVFSRVILPNGDSISLQGMPGIDLSGYAGLEDEVDEHWFRILGSVVMAALLNASSEELSSNSSDVYVKETSEQVAETSSKIIMKQLNIQPTITIRPGWDFNIFVKKDMILKPYFNI